MGKALLFVKNMIKLKNDTISHIEIHPERYE